MSTLRTTTLEDIGTGFSVEISDLVVNNTFVTDLTNPSDPSKGASLIPRVSQVVSSVAALRLLNKLSASKFAFVTGYYLPGDGGGGQYYYDAADTTSPDNGGSLIVAADGGRWKLVIKGQLSVKQFGARGNGVSDDTSSIQAAINSLTALGGEIFFPKGVYISTGVSWTVTTVSFTGYRISLIGEGPAESVIKGIAFAPNTSLVSITADTGAAVNSVIFGGKVSGMGFELTGTQGDVFKVVNSAYMYYENCYFSGGFKGFNAEGCLSSTFINCKFSYAGYGFYAIPGFSFPNQLSFFQCVFGSNTIGGLYAKNPGGVRLFGGSVEGNGFGNPNGFGVILDHAAGTSSGTPITGAFYGVYFEFNNGIADVYLGHNNSFDNLSLSVNDCSFACGGSSIVTDRIKIEHLTTSAITANIEGCNFSELSGFVPTIGQKYINVTGAGAGSRKIYANANYYNSSNSAPAAGVVLSSPVSLSSRIEAYSGTTNVSGLLTIPLVGFSAAPSVSATVVDATASTVYSVRATTNSNTSVTFEVLKSAVAGGAWTPAGTVSLKVIAVGS